MRLTALSICALLALAFVVPMAGCGIKPNKVDPPPSVKVDKFPKTYPNQATDPKPAQPELAQPEKAPTP